MLSTLKRLVVGIPIASADEQHHRLSKKVALPVFASDAISSSAYAPDAILGVLLLQASGGFASFTKMVPIAVTVVALLAIVVTSYRQTIFAYPSGGGSYIVSRANLGDVPALIAGSALLVDYILTVAVSVAGGVLAIRSAAGLSASWAVPLCLVCIVLMMFANLRGVKESGALFAPPTYAYVALIVCLIAAGVYRVYVKDLGAIPAELLGAEGRDLQRAALSGEGVKAVGLLMLLRAFSSGAVALSGVEAVANGVPAFKKSEPRNASVTLMWMGAFLGVCFFGISLLASRLKPFRGDQDATSVALMAEWIYGGKGVMFWATQIATFAILIVAANTAYADFPRLSSIIARDGFLPRQFANRGDRLVFSNGVIFLTVVAALLIVVFKGDISALIPLYAFGVFTAFTLSQAGMVRHHLTEREPGWPRKMVVNAIGALTTLVIATVVVVSKFTEGAWIPAVLVPIMVVSFRAIGRHYERLKASVAVEPTYKPPRRTHYVVVLVKDVNKGVVDAITYARSLAPERLIAVSVVGDEEEQQQIAREWDEFGFTIPLHTISSPYRELTRPLLAYLDELDEESPDDVLTVVIPEFVTKVRTQWLHNQSALALKARLLYRPNTVVTSVPVHVD